MEGAGSKQVFVWLLAGCALCVWMFGCTHVPGTGVPESEVQLKPFGSEQTLQAQTASVQMSTDDTTLADTSAGTAVLDTSVVYEFFTIDQRPEMIGGVAALYDYMHKHKLYPDMAWKARIEGDVSVVFVVDSLGVPRNLKVSQERPQGLGFGNSAVQALTAMRFTPGVIKGKPVSVRMQQVVQFRLR